MNLHGQSEDFLHSVPFFNLCPAHGISNPDSTARDALHPDVAIRKRGTD
jgi:hypothetical protein